ncbi:hypothetical protein [Devosia indica]
MNWPKTSSIFPSSDRTDLRPGSIVRIFAPVAGKEKYQLCLSLPAPDGAAARFLFLNSEAKFKDHYVVDNSRVPCLPPSRTGETCFCFTSIIRMSDQQLQVMRPTSMGEIDLQLAVDLRAFADTVRALAPADMKLVKEALDLIIEDLSIPF